MAKLQTFDGGKVTRVAPHLIPINSGVQYSNIDNSTGELRAVANEAASGETLNKYAHYFEAENRWISDSVDTDYLEYQERLFHATGAGVPQWTQGAGAGSTHNLGILAPATAPTVALGAGGAITGTYQYAYTYYSSTTGAESAPSPVSAEIVATANQINLTGLVAAADPQADKIRIYRVGGTILSFQLVATIASASINYTDNTADANIDGTPLTTEGSGQALAGGRYIKEAYGIVFYMLGDKLYFSEIGKWYSYPAEYYLDFGKPLMGYAFVSNGILVFTKHKTHLVTGTTPTNFSKTTLSRSQGCKTAKSVVEINNTAIWVSQDGICISSGAVPRVISRGVLGKLNLQVANAVVHDDVYYAQLLDGTVLAYDSRFSQIFKDLQLGTSYLVVVLGKLYGYFGTQYKELFVGNDLLPLTWQSAQILDGAYTESKTYNSIYIRYEGELAVTVLIEGKVATNITLSGSGTYELDVDQTKHRGYYIQFIISGKGVVKEIEYGAVGNRRP